MYTLTWMNGHSLNSICSGSSDSIWEAYWAISKLLKGQTPVDGSYIMLSLDGRFLDPTAGMLPCKIGEERIQIVAPK